MRIRILFATCALAATCPVHAGDWQWSLTPYVWATDVGLDIKLRDRQLVEAEIGFDDLLRDLDSAVLFRVEAMQGDNGVALDVFDVVLADDVQAPLPGGSNGEVALDVRVGTTIIDLAAVHVFAGEAPGWSLRYGTRILNQREDLAATVVTDGVEGADSNREISDTFVDALIGLHYEHVLSERWRYEVSADFSAGGTDFTWSVNPSVSYGFGARQQYRVIAGYRYLAIDFAGEPAIDNDMTLSGALIGLQFNF